MRDGRRPHGLVLEPGRARVGGLDCRRHSEVGPKYLPPARQAPANTGQIGPLTRLGQINRLLVEWTGVVQPPPAQWTRSPLGHARSWRAFLAEHRSKESRIRRSGLNGTKL